MASDPVWRLRGRATGVAAGPPRGIAALVSANILLTGGSGQIGTELRRIAPTDWSIIAPSSAELDIANPHAVWACVASQGWSAVVNAAAYTAVDRAQEEIATAWRVNALGPAALAEATARAGVPLVHLSTDYVFDGRKSEAYVEDDPVCPLSVYGASKEGGEQAVRTANPRHVILRTAWIVSPHGANFAKTMLRLAAERPLVRVVDDQWGNPTSATDVAGAMVVILGRLIADDAASGTYHFVNDGDATWCALARAIFARLAGRTGTSPTVEAISTADYPTAARRPANSRLSTTKLKREFGIVARPWRRAVDEVVDALMAEKLGVAH